MAEVRDGMTDDNKQRKSHVFTPQKSPILNDLLNVSQEDSVKENTGDNISNSNQMGEAQLITRKQDEIKVDTSQFKDTWIVLQGDVPSKMLAYPEGAVIKYRPYYFGEIKNYSQSVNTLTRDRYQFILNGIETVGFDKLDLTISDFMFIGLLRRMSSIGNSDILARAICRKCGSMINHRMKCSDIDISYLEVPKLPIKVNFNSGQILHFMPLTVRRYFELEKEQNRENSIAYIAKCCTNLPYKEAYDILDKLIDSMDISRMEKVDELLYHSVKPVKVICNSKIRNEVEATADGKDIIWLRDLQVNDPQTYEQLCREQFKEDQQIMDDGNIIDLDTLGERMGFIRYNICSTVNLLEIDTEDVMISPFRDTNETVEDGISFG